MQNNKNTKEIEAIIKLIEQRYLLAERFPEKYTKLNDNLTDICQTLEITDSEIKNMQKQIESININLQKSSTEDNAKTIVKNYTIHGTNINLIKPSLTGEIINFFKNIAVVDFMVLNKKIVVSLILLLIVLNFGNYGISQMGFFPELDVNVRNALFVTSGYSISMILIGLILPLLVKSILNYVVLAFGIWCASYVVMMINFNTTVSMRGPARIYIELAIIIGLPILYGMLISYLRKKYAFKISSKK